MTGTAATSFPDPYHEPDALQWSVIDASRLERDIVFDTDVAIIGSGAGGGVAAEILAAAGLKVVLLEEGPLKTSSDFRMLESDAYPQLYQESAARKTADRAINILQGRCVGGGTTVNWTSSFRTPPATLAFWASEFGLRGFGESDLAPWFARMEARLSMAPWPVPPNANNAVLARGAERIGIPAAVIRRNVKSCWNIGYCGMGCPTNAKQSMLVTSILSALKSGATLVTRARAERFAIAGERVTQLNAVAMDTLGVAPTARKITIRARTFIAAAGAIGTPGLLLRTRTPDPHHLLGKRTFLHPSVVSAALMPERIEGFAGAPQTIYSDHFLDSLPVQGPIGYKLEAAPIHPVLAAITLPGDGLEHSRWMADLSRMQVVIALLRDGFHPQGDGGSVRLRDDGTPVLDYPLTPYVWDGVRRALLTMAEIQFAAGAIKVMPIHAAGVAYGRFSDARAGIDAFDLKPRITPIFSAHVMGGAPIGPDPRRAVVGMDGRHHQIINLYVLDGSLFPTSIGANPQLSIYSVVARLASELARALAP